MSNSNEEFVVSEADAEIIATLFRKGINDFDSIVKELHWSREKNLQLLDYIIMMGYMDIGDFDDFDEDPDDMNIRIAEEHFSDFFQNLPIEFSDDWFDEEWHESAYRELRDFLIQLGKAKGKRSYSIEDARGLIGATFCPLTQKPESLCTEIMSLVAVDLRKIGKKEFSFTDILKAFDKAFANYF